MKVTRQACAACWIVFFIFTEPSGAGEYDFSINEKVEIPIFATAGAGWLGVEIAKEFTDPGSCRWCPVDEAGKPVVNRFDMKARELLKWDSSRGIADTLSTLSGFVLLPVAGGVYTYLAEKKKENSRYPEAFFVVAESTVFTAVFTQITKYSFLRRRPYAHFGTEKDRKKTTANLSFISGHSSLAFSIATSFTIIAVCRDYPYKVPVSAIMYILALSAAYLRIAADKHYLTDVIAGTVAGAGIGALNTLVHLRSREEERTSLLFVPAVSSGSVLGVTLRF